jgi:hypothetical protein
MDNKRATTIDFWFDWVKEGYIVEFTFNGASPSTMLK